VTLPDDRGEIIAELLMPPIVFVLRVFNTSHVGHLDSERSRSFSRQDVAVEHEHRRAQDIQVAAATFQTLDADRMVDPMRVTLEVIELRFAQMAVQVSSSGMEHERPLADLLARLSSDSGICAQGLQGTWASIHLVLNLSSEADPLMATVQFVHDQLTRQMSEYRHSLACLSDLRDGILSVELHSSQLREELYSAILLNPYRDLLLACLGFKTVNLQLQEYHISAMQKTSDDAWAMDTLLIQLSASGKRNGYCCRCEEKAPIFRRDNTSCLFTPRADPILEPARAQTVALSRWRSNTRIDSLIIWSHPAASIASSPTASRVIGMTILHPVQEHVNGGHQSEGKALAKKELWSLNHPMAEGGRVRRRNVLRLNYIPITGEVQHVVDKLPHKTPHPAQDPDLDVIMGDATVHSSGTSRPSLYRGIPSLPARGPARSAAIYRFGPRLDPRILHRHQGPRFGAVGRERKERRSSPPPGHPTGNGAHVETAGPRGFGARQREAPPSSSYDACNGGSGGGGADDEEDEDDGRGRIASVQRHPLPGEGSRSLTSTPRVIRNEPMEEPDEFAAAFEEIDQEENVAGPSKYINVSDDEEQADPLPVGPSRLGIVLQTARSGRTRKAKTTSECHFRMVIRSLVDSMMELPKGACPTAENFPLQRDIRRYEASRNPDDGPRGQPKLLIDIGRTGPSTIWNLACVDVVYDELRRIEDTSLPPKADVQEAFHAYMQTLHTKYIRERDGTKPSRLKTNTKSRMRSAYERRLEGWRLHLHLPGASKHFDQWEELSADVVSPDRPTFVTDDEPAPHYDESKRQQFIYVSRRPHWRNPAEDSWFYVGSLLQWSTHFKKNGKARRGNYPAQRIRNHLEIDYSIPAPSNLPINFYDPGWLTESRRKAAVAVH
ncbi:hypothetical protein HDZ31DRAFT_77531, partial [Schizophyllum fasciatum]